MRSAFRFSNWIWKARTCSLKFWRQLSVCSFGEGFLEFHAAHRGPRTLTSTACDGILASTRRGKGSGFLAASTRFKVKPLNCQFDEQPISHFSVTSQFDDKHAIAAHNIGLGWGRYCAMQTTRIRPSQRPMVSVMEARLSSPAIPSQNFIRGGLTYVCIARSFAMKRLDLFFVPLLPTTALHDAPSPPPQRRPCPCILLSVCLRFAYPGQCPPYPRHQTLLTCHRLSQDHRRERPRPTCGNQLPPYTIETGDFSRCHQHRRSLSGSSENRSPIL